MADSLYGTERNYEQMMAAKDHYELLGIHPDADSKAITRAYRAHAGVWHPDKHKSFPTQATEVMARLNVANDTLSDPIKRAAYDESLKAGAGLGYSGAGSGKSDEKAPDGQSSFAARQAYIDSQPSIMEKFFPKDMKRVLLPGDAFPENFGYNAAEADKKATLEMEMHVSGGEKKNIRNFILRSGAVLGVAVTGLTWGFGLPVVPVAAAVVSGAFTWGGLQILNTFGVAKVPYLAFSGILAGPFPAINNFLLNPDSDFGYKKLKVKATLGALFKFGMAGLVGYVGATSAPILAVSLGAVSVLGASGLAATLYQIKPGGDIGNPYTERLKKGVKRLLDQKPQIFNTLITVSEGLWYTANYGSTLAAKGRFIPQRLMEMLGAIRNAHQLSPLSNYQNTDNYHAAKTIGEILLLSAYDRKLTYEAQINGARLPKDIQPSFAYNPGYFTIWDRLEVLNYTNFFVAGKIDNPFMKGPELQDFVLKFAGRPGVLLAAAGIKWTEKILASEKMAPVTNWLTKRNIIRGAETEVEIEAIMRIGVEFANLRDEAERNKQDTDAYSKQAEKSALKEYKKSGEYAAALEKAVARDMADPNFNLTKTKLIKEAKNNFAGFPVFVASAASVILAFVPFLSFWNFGLPKGNGQSWFTSTPKVEAKAGGSSAGGSSADTLRKLDEQLARARAEKAATGAAAGAAAATGAPSAAPAAAPVAPITAPAVSRADLEAATRAFASSPLGQAIKNDPLTKDLDLTRLPAAGQCALHGIEAIRSARQLGTVKDDDLTQPVRSVFANASFACNRKYEVTEQAYGATPEQIAAMGRTALKLAVK